MAIFHISSPHLDRWIFRQTPHNDGVWHEHTFKLEDEGETANWLVVYDRHEKPLVTRVPKERRILFVTEPPEVFSIPKSYLGQFGTVCSFYSIPEVGAALYLSQTALPWFYGVKVGGGTEPEVVLEWRDLAQADGNKERDLEITAICSKKTLTKNQIRRLRFLEVLKDRLGDRLKIYGRGFEQLDDKSEVIARSRYHLALENSFHPHYWSEKLADPILGGAFPIYAGGKHATDDFDKRGILDIDISTPKRAVENVVRFLDEKQGDAPEAKAAQKHNKTLLMNKYNFFALCSQIAAERGNEMLPSLGKSVEIIWPDKTLRQKIMPSHKKLKSLLWKASVHLFERG
ncbi:glycosyltransferase family 10 [Pseudovibrio sp. Tun.PSC04-5.I4]|uniref:glycosyltransferase family 10 domain-containing protein n=1 Tax=Pseudovibrio sp. Tun.PSC04-5.I4 TaxID=1798213 RepID=UPI00088260FE|nr:glycosyltransferase family 10 [Pseudovibrio sp. Tun.PSC04-5.I4]SDR47098.1 Glycosyltransferase family 10 (fucosyltransferase) C-term [Pseudovibrio sp. Tun.PSC04-5.I4]